MVIHFWQKKKTGTAENASDAAQVIDPDAFPAARRHVGARARALAGRRPAAPAARARGLRRLHRRRRAARRLRAAGGSAQAVDKR